MLRVALKYRLYGQRFMAPEAAAKSLGGGE
jgi:hypothetical protein